MGDTKQAGKQKTGFMWFLRLLGSLAFAGAVILAWRKQSTEMGFAVAAAVVLLVVANWDLESIRKVKVPGLELERELRKVADEATAKLHQLQEVSLVASSAALEAIAGVGLINPVNGVQRVTWRDRILGLLRDLEVPEQRIEDVAARFNATIRWQHAGKILNAAHAAAGQDLARYTEFSEELTRLWDWHERSVPRAARLREILRGCGLSSSDLDDSLADLEHFEQSATYRRPNLWLD